MFSKFLHGTAILNPEICMEVPYWFLPDEGRRLTPASYDEMADTTDEYLKVLHCFKIYNSIRVNTCISLGQTLSRF